MMWYGSEKTGWGQEIMSFVKKKSINLTNLLIACEFSSYFVVSEKILPAAD